MITRLSHSSVLALWLLIDHVLSQPTTASFIPTNSALPSTSTFASPSLGRIIERGLTEDDKIGISIGVTFAAILIVGSTAIYCVIRGRRKALAQPETRGLGSSDINDESLAVGDDPGKGKQVYYMNPPRAANQVLLHQAPDGTIYQTGGYPTISEQPYAPHPQAYATQYPTTHPGETYAIPGTAYPGSAVIDPSQQNGYAGPSNAPYQSEAYIQPQQYQYQHPQQQQQEQQQQRQGSHVSWTYPASATSPVQGIPAPDFQDKYLQDYQQPPQDQWTNQSQYQDRTSISNQGYQEDPYYVPPPHPHASELPDQRKPVELMGEGHYKEVP